MSFFWTWLFLSWVVALLLLHREGNVNREGYHIIASIVLGGCLALLLKP